MKRAKRKPMPRWIWQLPHSQLNYKLKHLLAYFWWCQDRGCQRWNYAIAKRFKVSDRTIRRWIKALNDKRLIYINFPMKTTRTIYRRPYFTRLVWWQKSGQIKDLAKNSQETPQLRDSRPKVAYISNAQRTITNKTGNSTLFSKGNGGEKHPATAILPSIAGELGGSRVLSSDFKTPKKYFAAKLKELNRLSESNGATGKPAPTDKSTDI